MAVGVGVLAKRLAWYHITVIAFHLPGGVPVYVFALLLGLGATAGLGWVAWQTPSEQTRRYVDAGLFVLLGSALGGRGAYVAVHWPYFQAHLWEIPQLHLGGLAWPGALAGWLLALVLFAILAREPLGTLADALLPLAGSITVSAWLGCWVDGCAYGSTIDSWWAIPARDEWGTLAPRGPVQLLGALLTLGIFWLLNRNWNWLHSPGLSANLGLLGLSLELFVLSFLRSDPAPFWHGLRLETWAALAFVAASVLPLLIRTERTRY